MLFWALRLCERSGGPTGPPRGAAGQWWGQKVVGDGTGDAGLPSDWQRGAVLAAEEARGCRHSLRYPLGPGMQWLREIPPITVGLRVVGKWSSTILYKYGSERKSFSLDRKVRVLPPAVPSALDGQQHVNSQTTGCVTHRWSCSQRWCLLPGMSGGVETRKLRN